MLSVYRRSLSVFTSLLFLCLIGSARIVQAQQRTANGSLLLAVEAPERNATVAAPFLVGGWALDTSAVVGTNIDAIHVWAFPVTGAGVFLGAATPNVPRPDVAAAFGANFREAGFYLVVTQTLRPGAYTLQVYGRRASTGTFDVVQQVPITVRGITLSDIGPCAAGEGPQFDGTSWVCATSVGATGPAGPQGTQGVQGPPGPMGPAGSLTTMYASVSSTSTGSTPQGCGGSGSPSDHTFNGVPTLLNTTLTGGCTTIQLGGTGVTKAFRIAWGMSFWLAGCSMGVTVDGIVQPQLTFTGRGAVQFGGSGNPVGWTGGEGIVMIPDNAAVTLRGFCGGEGFLTVIQLQ